MFLLLLVIVSSVTLLIFIRFNEYQDNALFKVVTGICFTYSWATLVMWFTSLIERWQIALNTPGANDVFFPVWERTVLDLLQDAVYLLPISRLALGLLYASPLLLIPMVLAVIKRSQVRLVLIFSTLVNLFFIWTQVIVDNRIPVSFTKISIQGIILSATYVLALLAILFQRPGSSQQT